MDCFVNRKSLRCLTFIFSALPFLFSPETAKASGLCYTPPETLAKEADIVFEGWTLFEGLSLRADGRTRIATPRRRTIDGKERALQRYRVYEVFKGQEYVDQLKKPLSEHGMSGTGIFIDVVVPSSLSGGIEFREDHKYHTEPGIFVAKINKTEKGELYAYQKSCFGPGYDKYRKKNGDLDLSVAYSALYCQFSRKKAHNTNCE